MVTLIQPLFHAKRGAHVCRFRLTPGAGAAPTGDGPAVSGTIHLNSADVAALDALPGIGPATAQRIVDWREQNGGFRTVDDLEQVPGIGPAKLDALRDLVAP